jgi:hypothetical protein
VVTLALAMPTLASPPACLRDDTAMVAAADAVVTGEVLSATASRSGARRRLEARYRVTQSLKGRLRAGHRVRVVASCLDEPVPAAMLGYPTAQRYCRGGIGPALTGVEAAGSRSRSPAPASGWILFLTLTPGNEDWHEVSRTGYGSACRVDDAQLSAQDRRAVEWLRQRSGRPRRRDLAA